MMASYTQAGACITRSIKFAKKYGGASYWLLSTFRIAELRRFVYAVSVVKGCETPRFKTKSELASWLFLNGPRLPDSAPGEISDDA